MWHDSIIAPTALMLVMSVVFYKLNLRFLYDGHLTIMLWIAAGVPILVVALALLAAFTPPPRSYVAIAALVALSNALMGLGFKILGIRMGRRDR